jgi:hypothetical protein
LPIVVPLALPRLFTVEVSIIEADKMEILAIVVLCASTILGFSTTETKPKTKTNTRRDDDPDSAFIESYDSKGSSGEG